MIVGLDKDAISSIADSLSEISDYSIVRVKKQRDANPENKLYIIKLENNSSLHYQSLLYYYLELPLSHNCFVCLVSTSSLSLDFFEKRVRSRFKNKIFFIPYFDRKESKNEPLSSPRSLEESENARICQKYNLERFTHEFLFELLEPIHFALIIISFYQRLNPQTCFKQFKIATLNTPELKKVSYIKIFNCTYDLIECNIINNTGQPCIEFSEFKSFINKKGPQYLKTFFTNMQKSFL